MKKILVILTFLWAGFFIFGQVCRAEEGLVGYWSFDEEQDNIAYDSSGNGNNGTIYDAIRVDGISGRALSFDGRDYVEFGDKAGLEINGDWSFSGWIKTEDSSKEPTIIVKGMYTIYLSGHALVLNCGKIKFGLININLIGGSISSNSTVNLGKWKHIGITRNGTSGEVKIYIDGLMDNTKILPTGSADAPSRYNFLMGMGEGSNNYFNGVIDEVCIYNRVLSAEEIETLYEVGTK